MQEGTETIGKFVVWGGEAADLFKAIKDLIGYPFHARHSALP
jgi:hypothetical protein